MCPNMYDGSDPVTDSEVSSPVAKLDGVEEITVECAVEDPELCAGWETQIELKEPAYFDSKTDRIRLPGFSWECGECGNPHEFFVNGVWVIGNV